MNAAREYAEDVSVRWKGMRSDMQNTRAAGMYS